MGLAVVNGLQGQSFTGEAGSNKYKKLLACAKHFAVHSGPEWNRHVFDVQQLPELRQKFSDLKVQSATQILRLDIKKE